MFEQQKIKVAKMVYNQKTVYWCREKVNVQFTKIVRTRIRCLATQAKVM